MSGICGIVSLDGRTPSEADIRAMTNVLERRGPDGTHIWLEGKIALGHTLLATTPEALIETLPFTHQETGCTITADVRLDNREELLGALGLSGNARVIGDGELILQSYLKWGEACAEHLLGDFAFAVWDPRVSRLLCARDHMGMRQLNYYHFPGSIFVLATQTQALFVHPRVPKTVNEARIADYLAELEGIDHTSTFFTNVFRLPPGHLAIVDPRGLQVRKFWELQFQPELRLRHDTDYEDAFREVLTNSVECRLRSNGPVGLLLSGGIDSASIAAIAAKCLSTVGKNVLHTFSAVGPDPTACPETFNIHTLLSYPGTFAHLIDYSQLSGDLERLREELLDSDEPFDGHMNLPRAAYLAASREPDLRVVLDGASADIVLSAGKVVAQMVRGGHFATAIREAKGLSRFWGSGEPDWKIQLIFAIRRAWTPQAVREITKKIRAFQGKSARRDHLIRDDFRHSQNIERKLEIYHNHFLRPSSKLSESRLNVVRHPHEAAARERYDRVASRFAIEARAPFLDRRLVEFCLSLPSSQLQRDGWPKHLLRRCFADTLPSAIVWKEGKHHLGGRFSDVISGSPTSDADRLMATRQILAPYIEPSRLDALAFGPVDIDDLADQRLMSYLANWLHCYAAQEF